MDDITLFDDNPAILQHDFIRIQNLLGQYALNVNPAKTHHDKPIGDVVEALSDIHNTLLEIVHEIHYIPTASGVESVEIDSEIEGTLNQDQIDALLNLLKDENVEETDAERILFFLRSYSDSILEHIPALLAKFPNLIKHIYAICGSIKEKAELTGVILDYLKSDAYFLEYQLFWLTCIVEDYLMGCGCYGEILLKLYELTADLKIARAKILEIPEQGFGFKDVRNEFLKTGQSDWLSWASAIGTRSLKAAERNYVLDYFSKASPLNFLVAECAKKL